MNVPDDLLIPREHERPRLLNLLGFCLRCIEILVYSNVVVAAAAASVAVTTMLLVDLPLAAAPPAIVFAATIFVYNLNRLTDREEDAQNVPRRSAFTRRYGAILLAVGIVLYIVASLGALTLGLPRADLLGLPLVVGTLYSVVGLKRVFVVKNLLVGGAWGLIPLGVGVYVRDLWRFDFWFLATYVAWLVTIAAMIFDVKDIEGDRAVGIETVPTAYGVRVTRVLAQAANVAAAVVVVSLVARESLAPEFLALLAFHLYVGGYIPAARPDRGPLFYGFVVDGEHVFLAVLVSCLDVVTTALGV